jgi:hypothetical protein
METCCKEHRFGKQPNYKDIRASAGDGSRTTYTCNNCLTVKIVFDMNDGRTIVKVVEPV